ncbi:MAG: GUN4 domain-containing protein [Kastovskya adunca ATA6-11-RM4]|jgi:hypothetical protein|nr:GUN4 domain-containing protein [Kastovskya adunca ATA6-11-RM4]
MIYCLNTRCREPQNPSNNIFCQACGTPLLLKNRYRVIKPLGSGGFGRTYLAEDTDCLNALCVVKQFSPSPDIQSAPVTLQTAIRLFNQEALRLFELGEHPQIPRLLAHFEQNKQLYLVQEWIDGQNLRQELAMAGAFSEKKIRSDLDNLLPVLQFIHDRGVIHRDIKPDNIMRRRGDGKLMLIDFGVSKQSTVTAMSTAGTMVGTAGYTPMEQMLGKAYPASDLYSLGVTCICLLTNRFPKQDGSDGIYDPMSGRWFWQEHLPVGITVNPTLAGVLDKLVEHFPKDRYQSAAEVMEVLKSAPTEEVVSVAPDLNAALTDAHLSSAVKVGYRPLQALLAAKQWQEADRETRLILLQVCDRVEENWLRVEDFRTFPCEVLNTVENMWTHYSNGRFGYVPKKRIWDSLGGGSKIDYATWCRFGEQVGWRVNGKWLTYCELTFDADTAPPGHLPAGGVGDVSMGKWDLICASLAARLEQCDMR